MISAFLNGALSRQQENMEDLLTSCVFDALRYSGSHRLLIDWLRLARNLKSELPFDLLTYDATIDIEYWPPLNEVGCESCIPDLILNIVDSKCSYTVLVEAKYRSGKSSFADKNNENPCDQLAKEWDNLEKLAARNNTTAQLVYLTASVVMPREEIIESLKEIGSKRNGAKCAISWLSWRHLYSLAKGSSDPVGSDLEALLNRLELFMFEGLHPVNIEQIKWGFDQLDFPSWVRQLPLSQVDWRFKNGN